MLHGHVQTQSETVPGDCLRHARYISRLGTAPLPSNGIVPRGPAQITDRKPPFRVHAGVIFAAQLEGVTNKNNTRPHYSQSRIRNEKWGICDEDWRPFPIRKGFSSFAFLARQCSTGKTFVISRPRPGRRRSLSWKRNGYLVLWLWDTVNMKVQ